MKTRTLLLLSVVCGLAVLLAGTIQLLRLAGQDESSTLAIGEQGQAGDAVVVVDDYSENATRAVVTVTLSGVDDPDGIDGIDGFDGFALANVAAVVPPLAEGIEACTALTRQTTTCTLTFATEGFEGSSRQLVFRRADEQVRWKLK